MFTPLETMKTFIVEDNEVIRQNLQETLQELAGAEWVGYATNESDAVRLLTDKDMDWDLAIVDLFLETGSGLGVIEACKKRLPEKHMVVATNYATDDVRKRCFELGADAVFDKSREIMDLVSYCQQLKQA